jgi:hypothetical protein
MEDIGDLHGFPSKFINANLKQLAKEEKEMMLLRIYPQLIAQLDMEEIYADHVWCMMEFNSSALEFINVESV